MRLLRVAAVFLLACRCAEGFSLAATRCLQFSVRRTCHVGHHRASVSVRQGVLRLSATSEKGSSPDTPKTGLKVMKSDLMKVLSSGTGLTGAADVRNRDKVNEMLLWLEKVNPTESPAGSELLNGAWEMIYAGGYSQV